MLLGLALLLLVGVAPIVGGLVLGVAILGGLGALVLAAFRWRRQEAPPVVAPERVDRVPVAAGAE